MPATGGSIPRESGCESSGRAPESAERVFVAADADFLSPNASAQSSRWDFTSADHGIARPHRSFCPPTRRSRRGHSSTRGETGSTIVEPCATARGTALTLRGTAEPMRGPREPMRGPRRSAEGTRDDAAARAGVRCCTPHSIPGRPDYRAVSVDRAVARRTSKDWTTPTTFDATQ